MKILLLNGSPHTNGCTFTALKTAQDIFNQANIETKIIHVAQNLIHGCTACKRCKTNGFCVFQDIVNETLIEMQNSDALIIGSPVYYAAPNGTLLSFLNRFFYAGNCFALKPAAAIVSARRAGTTASLDVLNKYFQISQMPIVASSYWNMVHGNQPDEVLQDQEGLQTIETLANNMIWMLKNIEAGKQMGILPPKANKPPVRTNFIR